MILRLGHYWIYSTKVGIVPDDPDPCSFAKPRTDSPLILELYRWGSQIWVGFCVTDGSETQE